MARHIGGVLLAVAIGSLGIGTARADDDPPSLVGRLAVIDGTVSFHTKDETTWSAATPNYPITTGNALWADNGSHAVIQLGANDVNLGPQTELDVDRLDEQVFQASLPQGTVYLNLRGLSNGDQIQIATPRGTVNITQPGRYEVFSGDQSHPSTVTVLEGAAQVTGDNNLNLPVAAGQTGVLSDNGQGGAVTANLAPVQGDDQLVAWARSREPQAAPPPQEAAAMTGSQDLGNYGTWSASPDYGNVWYPQVAADWVPYRSGHWAWVAPWGWTWVDDAPWGFAPFHYGRWVRIGPRWAWAPRPVVVVGAPIVPIYAPALVTFVGDIAGVGVAVSLGGPSVGWVPLGPREAYYPPYRVSDRYARRVNVTYVKNVNIINIHNTTVINRNVTVNRFVNHDAVTVVSRDAMTRSQHIAGAVQHVDQRDLDKMHGYNGSRAPFAPTAQTAGLTPSEAKHYGFSQQQVQHKPSAGPSIQDNRGRNWNRNMPAGQPNVPQASAPQAGQHQQGSQPSAFGKPQQQNGAEQNNKWTNRGSRQPGAPVRQQPQGQMMNGQDQHNGPAAVSSHEQNPRNGNAPGQYPSGQNPLGGSNPAGQQNVVHQQNENGQSRQQKWNWTNNRQSRQPGAPVQSQPDVLQQGRQPTGQVPAANSPTVHRPNSQQNPVETGQSRGQVSGGQIPGSGARGQPKWQNQQHQQGDVQARQQMQQYQQRQHSQQEQQQQRSAQQQQVQMQKQQQQRQQSIQQQQQQQQREIQSRQPQQGGQQQDHASHNGHNNQQPPQVVQPQN
ncbi:MAG TPA: DUF6600 domain-containing protein [Dongiaceae bacterium]|nr:DUF6600 domain-containing protein [Dongiaceae bacterium]